MTTYATPISKKGVASEPEIDRLIVASAAVAIGVSGGKDSQAAALATFAYLDRLHHRGPRVLIHSDLGMVEWRESLPVCERLARHLSAELMVVRRPAGGLMERWEARWKSSRRRYANLETVTLVLPWSTPGMRFCTSELKTQVITPALRRRFKNLPIINVTGVRHDESRARAKLGTANLDTEQSTKNPFWHWRPIIEWTADEVRAYVTASGVALHRAYTEFQTTRVSCSFCVMSSVADLKAAASNPDHLALYRRMVNLEIASTFAFQGNRWLGDVAPHLLTFEQRIALDDAKRRRKIRAAAENAIPEDLLYVRGWPTRLVTAPEARLLAGVRRTVSETVGIPSLYLDAQSVQARYAELLTAREQKERSDDLHQAA